MLFYATMNPTLFPILILFFSQLNNVLQNIKPIFIFIFYLLNYKIYRIKSRETQFSIQSKLSTYKYFCLAYNENFEPNGTVIHKSFCPKFIYYEDWNNCMFLMCKKKFFEDIINITYKKDIIKLNDDFIPESSSEIDSSDESYTEDKTKKITYIVKTGEYGYFQYKTRKINLNAISLNDHIELFPYQDKLFKQIMNFYQMNNFCKVFIHGPPGCGKTYFSYIMAQKLGCYLCDTYNPYQPSSNFNEVYSMLKVNPQKPVILVFDEVDVLLEKIHQKMFEDHKKFSREIFDKTSWNNFMDKIDYGLFPYVILIMNSNKKKAHIDSLDKSYLRAGRINIIDSWN